MKKTRVIIFQGLVFSFIPAVCVYLSQSSILDKLKNNGYLGENINVTGIKEFLGISGVLLTSLLLTVKMIIAQIERNKFLKQRDTLLRLHKDMFVLSLESALKLKKSLNLNVRIFVPRKSMLQLVINKFTKNDKYYYTIRNVAGLADEGRTNNLKFQVLPRDKAQGMVGECFNTQEMLYDDNLKNTNSVNWNLNNYQKSKTDNLRFIVTYPLFNEKDEVIAIIAFDSETEVNVKPDDENTLTKAITNYSFQLIEQIPELFKQKGGII